MVKSNRPIGGYYQQEQRGGFSTWL